MKPLIKKEIRLLLPAWIAAMVLAIVPLFMVWTAWKMNILQLTRALEPCALLASCVPFIFALGLLFLGINSFGQELSSNSFGILLSQPVERRRVWLLKIIILAIAFVSIWLTALFLVSWQFDVWKSALSAERLRYTAIEAARWLPSLADLESFKFNALEFLTLSALASFSGSLWATLLLRQTANAFWVALLTPVAIVIGIGTVLGFFPISDQATNVVTAIVLLCYSFAGFLWSRKLFLRAQDTQWTDGNFLFPWRGKNVEQTGSFIRLPHNHFLALTWKEIRLHEVSLLIAAVLLAVHLAALALHPVVSNRNTKMLLELVWSLWLLMPLLIGCAAVAEERRLGVVESQLCLPVSRRVQFFIKFFIALFLSVILGAVAPSIIERTRNFGVTDWSDFWIFYAAPAIYFIAFYASTLARTTLQAIGLAIASSVIVGGVAVSCNGVIHNASEQGTVGRVICMIYLGVPVFLLVLAGLMFWNFKWLHQNAKLWRRNAAVILVAVLSVFVLANTIYCRPWELLTSIEPPPGPARLSGDTPVKLFFTPEKIIAVLPNGKLWDEGVGDRDVSGGRFLDSEWWTIVPYLHTRQFIGNSDGTNISSSYFFVLTIHSNGSLWSTPLFGNRFRSAQIGSDTDWRNVAGEGRSFFLLKNNGSLWIWGTNERSGNVDARSQNLETIGRDLVTLPVRISDETDWMDTVSFGLLGFAKKSNGSLWRWQETWGTNYVYHLVQCTNMSSQWLSYAYDYNCSAGVKPDGQLWFMYEPQTNWDWNYIPTYLKEVQLGSNFIWKAVDFSDSGSLIMLRDDNTLWKWKFFKSWNNGIPELEPFHAVQLGRYSDWIALVPGGWAGIALAADGSLWSWDQMSDRIWLAPSRQPVYFGNIFQGVKGARPGSEP